MNERERATVLAALRLWQLGGSATDVDVLLFRDGSQTDEYAREQWRPATGSDEPDGESLTGTHNDDFDVWVFPEKLGAEAQNSPNVDTLADVTTVRRIR